jgi:hypothetical protein
MTNTVWHLRMMQCCLPVLIIIALGRIKYFISLASALQLADIDSLNLAATIFYSLSYTLPL